MNKLGITTAGVTIAVIAIAIGSTVIATPSQKTPNKNLIAKILHDGLSMALELEQEDKKGYRINRMIKKGGKPWLGVVIAKSGRAYKASCIISNLMGEKFALPCDLTEIVK